MTVRSAVLALLLASCADPSGEGGAATDATLDASADLAAAEPPRDAAPLPDAPPPPPDAAPDLRLPGYTVDRTEEVRVELPEGRSELHELELPGDVLSLTAVIRGDHPLHYAIGRLEGPEGELLVAEGPPDVEPDAVDRFWSLLPGPFASPNRASSAPRRVGTLLAPNAPGLSLSPGRWRLRVLAVDDGGAPADTRARLSVLVKRGPAPGTHGRLDLHVHLTGVHGWTAENSHDPALVAALERVRTIYAAVGLDVVPVSFDDLPAAFQTVDGDPVIGGSLEQMLALARYEDGINLFLVGRIHTAAGDDVLAGVAGGVPGPIGHAGTSRSGVCVATALFDTPDDLGYVVAHELGHYLGLFHPYEPNGPSDHLPDTPDDAGESANLMNPGPPTADAPLTDGQAWVLHRNPGIIPTRELEER